MKIKMAEIHVKQLLSKLKFKFECPKCHHKFEAKFGKNECPNYQTILQLEPKNDWGNLRGL